MAANKLPTTVGIAERQSPPTSIGRIPLLKADLGLQEARDGRIVPSLLEVLVEHLWVILLLLGNFFGLPVLSGPIPLGNAANFPV